MTANLLRAAFFLVACVFVGQDAAFAQRYVEAADLAPPRAGLDVVPFPGLDALESSVAAQFRDARRHYEEAAAQRGVGDSALADAYGALGRILHVYEFVEAADACYRNATRLKPSDVRWLHLRGYLYQQTGRLEEAADLYLAARRSAPDDHAATVRLGEAYLALGRTVDAREQFQSALARYPAASNAGLGEAALREGRYKEAIQHFEAALERIPEATSIHYSLAMAYRGLGRLDEARAHLERRGPGGIRPVDPIVEGLQTLVQGERALVIQGRRAYEAGHYQVAADTFRKAIGVAPASVAARVNLGVALVQLGDASGAIELFETALRLEANDVVAHASLGMLFARQGRDPEAVDHLRAAFERAPDDANVSRELTRVLLRLGRGDDAIEVLTRPRAFDQDDEETLVSLSILLAQRERYREAVALLEDGHRRFPDRTPTTTTLARLLAASPDLSLRDGRRALDLALAIFASSPTPVDGETVALALAELGRCAEAAEWMRRAVTEAERTKNPGERARLAGEVSKYAADACRPPEK